VQNRDRVAPIGSLPHQAIAMRDQQLAILSPGETWDDIAPRNSGNGSCGTGSWVRSQNDLCRRLRLDSGDRLPISGQRYGVVAGEVVGDGMKHALGIRIKTDL